MSATPVVDVRPYGSAGYSLPSATSANYPVPVPASSPHYGASTHSGVTAAFSATGSPHDAATVTNPYMTSSHPFHPSAIPFPSTASSIINPLPNTTTASTTNTHLPTTTNNTLTVNVAPSSSTLANTNTTTTTNSNTRSSFSSSSPSHHASHASLSMLGGASNSNNNLPSLLHPTSHGIHSHHNFHQPINFKTEEEEQQLLEDKQREELELQRLEQGRAREIEKVSTDKDKKKVNFLCFDLTHYGHTTLFILLSTGVVGFFILNSFLEEFLFKSLRDFKFGWYMTAFELMCFASFAIIERRLKTTEAVWSHNAPMSRHIWVAIYMTASRGLTNVSLQYLNYPTQVIFKSMKLITVMIGSLFILKASFTLWEVISALSLVVSAILFSLGDVDTTPEFSQAGLIIVTLSLVADALHSNTQESLLKEHKSSVLEAMLYTNIYACLFSWIWVIFSGEFSPAYAYCAEMPIAYVLFVLRALVIYLGVLCFILMINVFGVVMATAVTTVRKILTILVSFLIFPKPFTAKHGLGFIIFCVGVAVSIIDKQQETARKNKQKKEEQKS